MTGARAVQSSRPIRFTVNGERFSLRWKLELIWQTTCATTSVLPEPMSVASMVSVEHAQFSSMGPQCGHA